MLPVVVACGRAVHGQASSAAVIATARTVVNPLKIMSFSSSVTGEALTGVGRDYFGRFLGKCRSTLLFTTRLADYVIPRAATSASYSIAGNSGHKSATDAKYTSDEVRLRHVSAFCK
jgi:hypothetical protein